MKEGVVINRSKKSVDTIHSIFNTQRGGCN